MYMATFRWWGSGPSTGSRTFVTGTGDGSEGDSSPFHNKKILTLRSQMTCFTTTFFMLFQKHISVYFLLPTFLNGTLRVHLVRLGHARSSKLDSRATRLLLNLPA